MSALKTHAEQLLGLLEREISLLKVGKLADAIALTQEKGSLLRAFEIALQEEGVSSPIRPVIEAIVKRAGECERHFIAVRNGMRSVITRMEGLDHDSYVGSYNQYGDKLAFTGATGGYLKKI
ncbi:MAG: hypothetical protein ACRBEQ_09740 [Hyphomonas sp.]